MPNKKITCLLIDDDREDQEIFTHALKSLDIEVSCEADTDGGHAIEAIKNHPEFNPDFIFIDINMPRMNGIECLTEIKKIERLKNTPVYLYSTFVEPKMFDDARRGGAADVLIKANSMRELREMLQGVLSSNGICRNMAAAS